MPLPVPSPCIQVGEYRQAEFERAASEAAALLQGLFAVGKDPMLPHTRCSLTPVAPCSPYPFAYVPHAGKDLAIDAIDKATAERAAQKQAEKQARAKAQAEEEARREEEVVVAKAAKAQAEAQAAAAAEQWEMAREAEGEVETSAMATTSSAEAEQAVAAELYKLSASEV